MRTLTTILIAAFIFAGCNQDAMHVAGSRQETPTVSRGTFQSHLSLSGTLVAETSVSITSPGDGYGLQIRWMADDGSLVKKGDKVLEMDNSAIVSQIDNLENSVISAGNDLAQQASTNRINLADKAHALRQAEFALTKAKLDADVSADAYPERMYEDMQLALGRAKSARTGALEALAVEKKVAKNSLEQKRIAYERTKRDLRLVNEKLKGYELSAPRDGVIVAGKNWREARAYRVGDKTWPGQPIVEIPDLSVMNIKAELSDVDDSQVKVGMKASCRLDAYPSEVIEGHVVSISPVARQAQWESLRRVFDVVVTLDTTDPKRMRPGMSARVDIIGTTVESTLLVARSALHFSDEEVTAKLASGSTTPVTLGPCNAQRCVVLSGLSEGQHLQGATQ